jgi:hypothetical protein
MSRQFAASANRHFEFQKRGQLLIGTHNETLFAAAMRVSNPDYSAHWNPTLRCGMIAHQIADPRK